MAFCFCFGFGRKMKLTGKSDNKSIRDKSSSPSALPAQQALLGSETPQEADQFERTQIFSYRELATATNNFNMEYLIGRGGFGAVFKGWLGSSEQSIAVKVLDKAGVQGDKEFLVEVLMLSLLRHENLVRLFGYCAEGDQRLIVYEYMPLGSVEDRIHHLSSDQEALDWNTRMQIALGAAKGLAYLHNEANPPVIYRDLKTANILLDHGYNPKLSDFGLAKLGPTGDMSHVSTRVMGTHGYCAPEYATTGKLTLKSDIYSFGVVMLELITGRKALMNSCDCVGRPGRYLVNWAFTLYLNYDLKQLVDPMLLRKGFSETSIRRALDLVFLCLRDEASTRPTISEVVIALDYIVECTSRKQKKKTSRRGGEMEKTGSVSSPEETTRMLPVNEEEEESKVLKRVRAVAEAKSWAMNWNPQHRQSTEPTTPSTSKC